MRSVGSALHASTCSQFSRPSLDVRCSLAPRCSSIPSPCFSRCGEYASGQSTFQLVRSGSDHAWSEPSCPMGDVFQGSSKQRLHELHRCGRRKVLHVQLPASYAEVIPLSPSPPPISLPPPLPMNPRRRRPPVYAARDSVAALNCGPRHIP